MTFKTRPPKKNPQKTKNTASKQPGVTCRGPLVCQVQKYPQEWAAGISHQTFSRGRRQEQSAHLPECEGGATPARWRKLPLSSSGVSPDPTDSPLPPGPQPQVQHPAPPGSPPGSRSPSWVLQATAPIAELHSLTRAGEGEGGRDPARGRCVRGLRRGLGAGAYSVCPLTRAWLQRWGPRQQHLGVTWVWSEVERMKPGNSPGESRHVFRKHAASPTLGSNPLPIGYTCFQRKPVISGLVQWRKWWPHPLTNKKRVVPAIGWKDRPGRVNAPGWRERKAWWREVFIGVRLKGVSSRPESGVLGVGDRGGGMFSLTSPRRSSGVTLVNSLKELAFLFLVDGEGRLTSFHQYVGEGETGVLASLMELPIIAQL